MTLKKFEPRSWTRVFRRRPSQKLVVGRVPVCVAACCCSVLQCVAVCCSVLQCVTVCCSVLQCVAVCCSVLQSVNEHRSSFLNPSVLTKTIAEANSWLCSCVCCSVLLQCVVAVCCSVLQCVAVCCSRRLAIGHISVCVCVCVYVCMCVYVCVYMCVCVYVCVCVCWWIDMLHCMLLVNMWKTDRKCACVWKCVRVSD